MQKIVIAYLATRTSDIELAKEKQQFMELDKDGDGKISREEMSSYASTMQKQLPSDFDVFGKIDINQSRQLKYSGILLSLIHI